MRNCYQCQDGRWLMLSIIPDQRRWELLKSVLDSELLENPSFVDVESRAKNPTALTAALDRVFATRTLKDWSERLRAQDVTFGPVAEMSEVIDDQQALASGVLVPFAGSDLMTVTSPFWIDDYSKPNPKPAPRVGENTDEVLAKFGYDTATLSSLRASGVIG